MADDGLEKAGEAIGHNDVRRRILAAGRSGPFGYHALPPTQNVNNGRTRTRRGKCALGIFSGSSWLTFALIEAGVGCIAPFEILHGPHHDIMRFRVRRLLRNWLIDGLVGFVWFGTPYMQVGDKHRTAAGHRAGFECARFTAQLFILCHKPNIPYLIEKLRASGLWGWPSLRDAVATSEASEHLVSMCAHGTEYKRETLLKGHSSWYAWRSRPVHLSGHP